MGLLNRFLGGSAARGPRALALGYEASRMARRLKGWRAEKSHVNALLRAGGVELRARARHLCRENPYAANALDSFTAAAVGAGIKPSPLVEDAAVKAALQRAWLRWTDESDADGLTDFYGQQALAARAMFEAGECFLRFRPRRPEDGLSVPLQIQLLESEQLPLDDNRDLPGGQVVRSGIQFDAIGRRVAYHFLREHPGDRTLGGIANTTVVPAAEVMHVYQPLRPGQIRGQPKITPAMVRLYLLDQYDDAELDRKKVAAMFAGFITRQPDSDPDPKSDSVLEAEEIEGATAQIHLEPGMMQYLEDGEDIKFSEPAEVGGSYEAFQYRTLLACAAGLGLPYHAITGDVAKANYSSLRASQVEFRRRMDQFQHATLVYQMCRPVWRRWLEAAVLAGAIPELGASAFARNREDFLAAKWITPKWDWVDPLKDGQAEALAQMHGWKARSDIVEATGYDAEEVDARIAQDRAREAELGLSFGAARTAAAGDAPPGAAPQESEGEGS